MPHAIILYMLTFYLKYAIVFPLATHSACFFHLSQNIFKKLQSLGLSSMYSNDPEFNLLAKQIPALAFLPANMVSMQLLFCNFEL